MTLDEAHESGEEDAPPKLSVEDTRLLQRQRQRQTVGGGEPGVFHARGVQLSRRRLH